MNTIKIPEPIIEGGEISNWSEIEHWGICNCPTWVQAYSISKYNGLNSHEETQKLLIWLLCSKLEHHNEYYHQQIMAGNFSALPKNS